MQVVRELPIHLDGMAFEPRHLHPSRKATALAAFAEDRRSMIAATTRSGERGFPDADILPWCDQLNALEGICTLQSCAGHLRSDGTLVSGQLWLWLTPDISREFHFRAFELARHSPRIERVRTIYTQWGQEVAAVTFAGNERNLLAESMQLVVAFFSDL